MRTGKFEGEVLTTLKFLEESQRDQILKMERMQVGLNGLCTKYSVMRWAVAGIGSWLAALTVYLIQKFL